jgi:hypothetical protein
VDRDVTGVGLDGTEVPTSNDGAHCFRGTLEPDGLRVVELRASGSAK